MNHEFVVVKKSYTYQRCAACEGEGKRTREFRKMRFVEDCPVCRGLGRKRFTISEEVPLLDAIKELNINLTI